MDGLPFQCPNCGASVLVDFKTRQGYCEFCNQTSLFSRKTFNQDDKVQNELAICIRYFGEKRFDDAKHHADSVLSIAIDNAPALFVRAYYEAYVAMNKNSERMTGFFRELAGIEVDAEEVPQLVDLFSQAIHKLDVHEEAVLQWAKGYLDPSELLTFVDSFSPYTIGKRGSIEFFTPTLASLYREVAGICSAPKTCYALLQAIEKNPDSPYPNNRFFLKTKTQRFYHDFVLPVGEIIGNMASDELREKFGRAYQVKRENFEKQMNGGIN